MINKIGSIINSITKKCEGIGIILGVICIFVFAFLFDCLVVWVCMELWNLCLVAAIPSLAEVDFWRMWGIYFLCSLVRAAVSTTESK